MLTYKLAGGVAAIALGVAVTLALPGFAPEVEASLNFGGARNDRADIGPVGSTGCLQAAWPHGCQWRLPTEAQAGRPGAARRFGAVNRDRRVFHWRRVHGVLTKHRIARR
jgi:hypothetical protein